ncbi:putative tRNA (uracil-5-)-methyltransferase [Mollisia scopiformis]|uniref:tRNA (uracil(54)-C(5))-methyltransferase n=1 Tax=Mollisia scopiformis TaxID=149040 RepID=A0A194XS79_MOLSC|nr:putative tRNA (uracil-5-)-methyltransferase [Mollisia scopiformis]KUJ23155.1 putative tRNA (uracil-5-)-methyltransferase [Mollisia scopiformis]
MEAERKAPPIPKGDRGHGGKKRSFQSGQWAKRSKSRKEKPKSEGSNEEVLIADVRALFAKQKLSQTSTIAATNNAPESIDNSTADQVESAPAENGEPMDNDEKPELPEKFSEVEVEVLEISSTGDGLAKHAGSDQIYIVPFSTPGDVVKAKVIKHFEAEHYTLADFVSVVKAGPLRDDTRVNCKYFSTCSGCQFQMMDYPSQLAHKKTIVAKAYKNFSQLPPELIPLIGETIGSPLQYGYRTKLTPHFDAPPGARRDRNKTFEKVPEIGFMAKNRRITLDIEDCPIGTDAVRMGMKRERLKVVEELAKYRKGATILLRESTFRVPSNDNRASEELPDSIKTATEAYTDFKSCVTDSNATSTEYIDDFVFTNIAGSFFQNNNSILPSFTQYIRDHIMPPAPSSTEAPIKYLIDAYSGSGLFTITLSSLFKTSMGIDISGPSITSAKDNAKLNNLPESQCTFMAADAPELFKSVKYPKDETVVVIDPPRKGCDESFLSQLMNFGPRRVVYVSCNVHTQARDVGVLVRGNENGGARYKIESLRGFDFFPQTGHVEGVAVLSRVEPEQEAAEAQ